MSNTSNERFLSRWSRMKRAATVPADLSTTAPTAADADTVTLPGSSPSTDLGVNATALSTMPGPIAATPSTVSGRNAKPLSTAEQIAALPSIDSLTMQSDYAPFFQPQVPEKLRNAAVKKLFADPHFNVMDGLDTYIDDYSKPDPLPEGMLAKISHARDLLDHPSNRKPVVEEAEVREESIALAQTAASGPAASSPADSSPEPAVPESIETTESDEAIAGTHTSISSPAPVEPAKQNHSA